MPILPENKHRYPDNWPEIRERILERDGHKCKWCGVPNYEYIHRLKEDKEKYITMTEQSRRLEERGDICEEYDFMPIKVILTVAHLNHMPEDNRDENLAVLCQLHHNRHDAKHRDRTRKRHQLELILGS